MKKIFPKFNSHAPSRINASYSGVKLGKKGRVYCAMYKMVGLETWYCTKQKNSY